jgi:hypothetical protein
LLKPFRTPSGQVEKGVKEVLMNRAVALDPLPRAIDRGRLASVCRACAEGIAPEQPVLYEYLLDGNVDSVRIPAEEWMEIPAQAWLMDSFHVDCYEELLSSNGLENGLRYVGRCRLSKHGISSTRPLSQCPACGADIEMRRMQAQTRS